MDCTAYRHVKSLPEKDGEGDLVHEMGYTRKVIDVVSTNEGIITAAIVT